MSSITSSTVDLVRPYVTERDGQKVVDLSFFGPTGTREYAEDYGISVNAEVDGEEVAVTVSYPGHGSATERADTYPGALAKALGRAFEYAERYFQSPVQEIEVEDIDETEPGQDLSLLSDSDLLVRAEVAIENLTAVLDEAKARF